MGIRNGSRACAAFSKNLRLHMIAVDVAKGRSECLADCLDYRRFPAAVRPHESDPATGWMHNAIDEVMHALAAGSYLLHHGFVIMVHELAAECLEAAEHLGP